MHSVSLSQAMSFDITNLGSIFRDRIAFCSGHYWLSNGDANRKSGRDHGESHLEVLSEELRFINMSLNTLLDSPLLGISWSS